jgi:hypothetical protein
VATTRACCDFVTARRVLTELVPDLMVTNARLGEYNGLHLAYFGKSLGLRTRAIIYADYHDAVLAEEVHSLGAFFELRSTLRHTLAAYLSHGLPSADRRDRVSDDRRKNLRGGRRPADPYTRARSGQQ